MAAIEKHSFTYDVNGERTTSYLAAGPSDGPLLIFVHGWPAIAKTWKHQLRTFAALGFRAVAPDMPGYGGSTARKVTEDYAQENINRGMAALLEHLGREAAIWIGHDWGCGAVWSFAEHYPEKTVAVCGMAVPSHAIELGLDHLRSTINRGIYPAEEYPDGQWSYQRFYEEHFEKATAWFDADPAAFLRVAYRTGGPASLGQPAFTSTVSRDGGWLGGGPQPDPEWRKVPIDMLCIDEETYAELVAAMEKTSFWGADAWYSNHARNRKYFDTAKNEGHLHMPALFIAARYDTICDAFTSPLAERQRKFCSNLTEATIDAGHWVAQEQPEQVNAVLARWIVEKVVTHWPKYWSQPLVGSRK